MSGSGARPRRTALMLAAAVWLVYAVSAGGSLGTGDAVAMLEQAKSIVDRGALDIPAHQSADAWRDVDGRYHSPFGIGQSLYDIPWLIIGRAFTTASGARFLDPDALPKALVAFGSSVTAACTVGFAFLLAWRMSNDSRASALAALVLAFATPLWPYSKYGFNAPLAACGLTIGVYGFVAGATTAAIPPLILGGVGFGVALLTRHELMLAAIVGLVWLGASARHAQLERRHLVAASCGIGVGLVVWAVVNDMRFGDPLWTGHRPRFSFAGVAGFTISPWGSLLLYAPAASAGLAMLWTARRQPFAQLIAGVILALTAFYASLDEWLGTRSYGPRYLVPLLPLLIAPLALWWTRPRSRGARWALLALCTLSVAVQLPAVLVEPSRVRIAARQPSAPAHLLDWQSSPLVITTNGAIAAVATNAGYLSGTTPLPQSTSAKSSSTADQVAFSLDLWWLYLVYLGGLSLPAALTLAAGMLAIAASILGRLWVDLAI